MAKVEYKHPSLSAHLTRWCLIRDCVDGDDAVKAAGEKYLPRPNAEDDSKDNQKRYKAYKDRAVFYNVTGRTLNGLVGQVFAKQPVIELPDVLEILRDNIDGSTLSIAQQLKLVLNRVLKLGRGGLLTDYPVQNDLTTMADIHSKNIRPNVYFYEPESIINWRTTTVGAQRRLSLVVLRETYIEDDDGFEEKTQDQYLVLRLTDGVVVSEIWRKSDKGFALSASSILRNAKGIPLAEIPFTFVGSDNNEPTVDPAPLYDLATLNIAHYRNSADYEESCFIVGQPTPVLTGLTQTWVDDVLEGTVQLGSRAAIPLPEGGSATLLQASPNTMPFEAMQQKERQMVALGAKIVEQRNIQRTATETVATEISESSILANAAKNVQDAYVKALQFAADFIGVDDSAIKVELNTDFTISKMNAQERAQLMAEWQSGAISWTEYRAVLKKSEIATEDDDDAKESIDADLAV